MEEKNLLKFNTAIPFPMLVYKVNVRYNEVRKASGIAYILLDVIEKTPDSEDTICDLLLKFGIPKDLHYIFGNEISSLIGTGILASDCNPTYFMNPQYFSEIKVKDVSLTAKGKKMFRDGAIPTGEEKVKTKEIFYSPVTRRFDVSYPLPYTSLDSSVLYHDIKGFLGKTIDISGLEDFIEANPTKVGLKAEELIVEVEIPEAGEEKQVRKEDGTQITINKSGVVFSFETSDETAYFNSWYSSECMTKCLLAKDKYKFVDAVKNTVEVPTVSLSELPDIVGAYIPSDVSKQANKPCEIFIDGGRLATNRKDTVLRTDKDLSAKILSEIGENAEFALLDTSALHYYSAVNVKMPCKQLGDTFQMQMLTESILDETIYKDIVEEIFEYYIQKDFDGDVARVVLFTVSALKYTSYFEKTIKAQLEKGKTVNEKIEIILKLNDAFTKNVAWKNYFVSTAEKLFAESAGEINISNAISKSSVLNPLRKALGMNNFDYVSAFAEEMKKTEDSDIVYAALLSAGFTIDAVLSVVNVVEGYAEKVVNNEEIFSDSDLGNAFSNIKRNLWKLNDMLGIKSLSEYTLKDDFNEGDFFNAYATLDSELKSVAKYEIYAPKSYAVIKKYIEIYEPIHDLLSIEHNASSHPEKITEKYIDEQIKRGKYKDAICDLFVKLQYDLRGMLNAEVMTSAHDLLIMAKDNGIIDSKQESALHKLRMCRNGLQHPEKSQIPFDKETIENWCDIVFAVKGERK